MDLLNIQAPGQQPGEPPLSPEEFRRRAQAHQDANPSAFDSLRVASESTRVAPAAVGKGKLADQEGVRVVDAVGRGVLQAGNEASNTIVGLGGWMRKYAEPALLDAYAPGFTKLPEYQQHRQEFLDWYDAGRTADINPLQVSEKTIEDLFGKEQHGLGGFIEVATQVATGVVATGGLAIEAGIGRVSAKTLTTLAQGAIIDAAFFDPYAKRIANVIEDAKLPFASDLASFMASHPDDNEAVVRFKAVLEGVMVGKLVGKTLHSLNAIRLASAAKAGKYFGGSVEAAEKEVVAQLKQAAKPSASADDVLAVVTNNDGSATVIPARKSQFRAAAYRGSDNKVVEGFNHGDARNQILDAGGSMDGQTRGFVDHDGNFVSDTAHSMDSKNVAQPQERRVNDVPVQTERRGAKPPMENHAQVTDRPATEMSEDEIADELNVITRKEAVSRALKENGTPQADRVKELVPARTRRVALEDELHRRQQEVATGRTFPSVAEAQAFAASVNEHARSMRLPIASVSKETLSMFREHARELLAKATSFEEVDALFHQWGSDFNFSRVSGPIEIKAQVEALSQTLPSITEMARAINTQPHEVTAKLAQSINRHMDVGDAIEAAKKMFGDTKELPQRLLAARGWLYAKGAEVARLSRIADSDPNNGQAIKELLDVLDQLWDFHAAAAGTGSNVARTLDAMKIDPTPIAEKITAREAVVGGDKAAQQATDLLDKTPKEIAADGAVQAEAQANGKAPKAAPMPTAVTPERAAARQAAEDALQELKQARADAANKRFGKDSPLTAEGETPNATDFSLARARNKAKAAIEAARKAGIEAEGPVSAEVAAHGEQRSRDVLGAASEQRSNPIEAPAGNGAKPVKNPIDELSKTLDAEERQLEAILEKEKVQGPREHNDPVGDYINNHKSPGFRLTSGQTKRQLRALARQIRLAEGNPDQILDALYAHRAAKVAAGDPTFMQKLIGFRMAAMLSGPKTLLINASSNMMAAMMKPTEMWYAGVRSSNPELRSQGADLMVGLVTEFTDSARAAWKALKAGEQYLDRSKQAFESATHEQAAAVGKTWLQFGMNVPSRLLMSTDEFFKQLNYRSSVRAQALRDARSLGLTEARDIAEHVESTMESAFALGGDRSATNPIALEYARVNTFTNDLGEGTVGKWIQEGAIKHPSIRLIMPFTRTPVNLFRWTWERTPGLARFSRGYKEAIAAGGERAAVAKAGVEMGTMMYGIAAAYAVAGNITGAGPASKELRRQWIDAGNQPYSIKIPGTEKWVSYRRADPVVTPVGLAATAVDNLTTSAKKIASETRIRNKMRGDEGLHPTGEMLGLIADFVHASGDIAEEDGTRMAAAFIASIAANVSSKTMLQGLVEFADALAGGEPFKVETFATNMIGSFVPNALRQLGSDDTLRETRGIIDEIIGRSPWSGNLEPRRNLFGEPVLRAPGYANRSLNPFTIVDKSMDPTVADELVALGRAMTMPAEQRLGGQVDMTNRSKWYNPANTDKARANQSPYDRMLEIMANPGDGIPSLKESLTKLVMSDEWDQISDGTAAQPGGMKYKLAATVIGKYQDMALARVQGEYPELAKELATEDAEKAAAAMQGEDGAAAVRRLFQPQR
jgi:hypothetical protein